MQQQTALCEINGGSSDCVLRFGVSVFVHCNSEYKSLFNGMSGTVPKSELMSDVLHGTNF